MIYNKKTSRTVCLSLDEKEKGEEASFFFSDQKKNSLFPVAANPARLPCWA